MKNDVVEQLQLASPEYGAALIDLTAVAIEVMDRHPESVLYHRAYSRLPLKSPSGREGEYYVISRSLPLPHPENPDWASIRPEVGKVEVVDSGLNSTTSYAVEEGVLTFERLKNESNEDGSEGTFRSQLSLDELRDLIEELKTGIPFNDEEEPEIDQRRGKIGRFVTSLFRTIRRTSSQ